MQKVADIAVQTLIDNGIDVCFSVVGGGAMHLNNAFVNKKDKIKTVYNHHEQACAMAAEGYAKACGKMASVCVTSGPGGINALNGVQGAYVDNTPMIIISGHPRYTTTVAYTGLNLRYRGVQEFDIVNTVKTMTKYAKLILNPYEIKREIYKAIRVATTGRRGPVWIDIPLDVQSMLIEENELLPIEKDELDICSLSDEEIKNVFLELKRAERPCILTGSGIRAGDAINECRKYLETLKIPVVGGALQADILNFEQPYYYGGSGNVGQRCGNFILQNADLILVLGNSLSYKQTGFLQEKFAPTARIIMVDAEEDEAKKPGLHIEKICVCDLKTFFEKSMKYVHEIKVNYAWNDYCNHLKKHFGKYEALKYIDKSKNGISSLEFWKSLLDHSEKNAVFALGNSSCIVPPLIFGISSDEQRVIVNYNSGSMGDDLPEAEGAAIALKQKVYCVTGDGSIMMNLQELETIVYNNIPVKIVVFSNHGYGAIRRTCKNFFDGVYTGCDEESGIGMPDFERIANAFQIPYYRCDEVEKIEKSIEWMQKVEGPSFLEVVQKEEDVIYPRLMSKMKEDGTFDDPELQDMYPFISKEDMKKWMYGTR